VAVRARGGRPEVWPPRPATTGEVSTDLELVLWPPPPGRVPSASACEPFREVIAEALSRGRNANAIWQDLVDDHGFRARYASVKRFVLKLRGGTAVEARVVITTAPGEEAQVDYGDGPMVRDPATGKTAMSWRTRTAPSTATFELDVPPPKRAVSPSPETRPCLRARLTPVGLPTRPRRSLPGRAAASEALAAPPHFLRPLPSQPGRG